MSFCEAKKSIYREGMIDRDNPFSAGGRFFDGVD